MLAITIITAYPITSDGSAPKVAGGLPLGRSTGRDGRYPRHEDTILTILCTGLPITATLVGQWLNSLITFNGDIKCITTNG